LEDILRNGGSLGINGVAVSWLDLDFMVMRMFVVVRAVREV